jgi:hypothetical protein
MLLLVKRDADLLEKLGGPVRRKRSQHIADDAGGPAPEVPFRDGAVRDVATRAAAHEDLRADRSSPVEAHDAQR